MLAKRERAITYCRDGFKITQTDETEFSGNGNILKDSRRYRITCTTYGIDFTVPDKDLDTLYSLMAEVLNG